MELLRDPLAILEHRDAAGVPLGAGVLKSEHCLVPKAPEEAGVLIGEAAFDLWLNNWNIEVMVWTDNHRQVPFGHKVATATFFGQNFNVWQSGSDAFAFVLDHNEQSGTVHMLSTLRWLIKHGKIPASSTLTSAQFGWEVCATSGSLVFHMSKYTNTTLPAQYSPAGK